MNDPTAVQPPAPPGLQETPTFGGLLVPDQGPETNDEFPSIVEAEAPEVLPSIVPDTTAQTRPPLSGAKAQERAGKLNFALGQDSPGMPELMHAIQEGTESSLRQRLADAESLKQRELKVQVIREKAQTGREITPEDVRFMTDITGYDPRANPETILERKFAGAIVNSLTFIGPDNARSPIAQAYRRDPVGLSRDMSVAEELMTRQEIVKNVLADIEAQYQDQSWGAWGWDTAKTVFPLYSALKLGWGSERSDAWLKGTVIQDMSNEYWGMPLERMAVELRKDLAGLAKDNLVLAREVAHAVLSHTSGQQFLDNAFTVFDAATFPGVGTALKGAKKGVDLGLNRAARAPLDFSKAPLSEAPGAAESTVGVAKAPGAEAKTVNSIPTKPEEGFVRYWKVEETWRGPDQKEMKFSDPEMTKQGSLFDNLPYQEDLSKLPSSLQPTPRETMSDMADRLREKWAVKDQMELDLSVGRTAGQGTVENVRPGSQMSLFDEPAPKAPAKAEPQVNDPTLFKSRTAADRHMSSSQIKGKLYLVDVNKSTGEIRVYDPNAKVAVQSQGTPTQAAPTPPTVTGKQLYGEGYNPAHQPVNLSRVGEINKESIIGFDAGQGRVRLLDGTEEAVALGGGTIWGKGGSMIDPNVVTHFKNLTGQATEWIPVKRTAAAADPATTVLKDTVRANANPTTDAGRQLNDMGDVQRAAEVRVTSRSEQIFSGEGRIKDQKQIAEDVPSIFRPDTIVEGLAPNLAQNMGRRLMESLQRNSERISATVANLVKVGRLPEEALQTAIRNESKRLQDDFKGPEDAILELRWLRPDDTASNVGRVSMYFGRKDGNVFGSMEEAVRYTRNHYGLEPMEFTVQSQGNGFAAVVTRHLDETDSLVRAQIKTAKNTVKPSLANTFLGWLRSADDRVPEFQRGNRLVVVHARSALENAFRDSIDQIGRMTKGDTEDLALVMKKNRTEPDSRWTGEGEPPTGNFYDTAQEFAESFHAVHGRFPSEQQTLAYFTYRQLNDWDWVMRNMGVYRDKARMGTESILLKISEQTNNGIKNHNEVFDGRTLKAIPWNAQKDAGIVVHRDGQAHEYYRLQAANADISQKDKLENLLKEGYKLIQVDNPTRIPGDGRLGNETVNFILTKDVEVRPIGYKQIPYRPGWHVEYPQEWFVKQPKIDRIDQQVSETLADGTSSLRTVGTRNRYQGDQAVLAFSTKAEADKYAKNMETARKLLNGDDAALEAFLRGNLPYDAKAFRKMFEARMKDDGTELPPLLDKNAPFLRTFTGNTTTDEYGDLLRGQFENFEDTVRSPWNRFQNVDKKFVGQRDDPLWTVKESGSELNPTLSLGNAEPIDPILSVAKAMSNIIRSRHFSDYKISHVEAWTQQFGHLLKVEKEMLDANPVFHIHNPVWREDLSNVDEISVAKNSRRALIELLGTSSEITTRTDHVRHQMMSSIYEKFGQAKSEAAVNSYLYKADKDPISLMRKTAFHVNIGLFNPYQLVMNAATMMNAIAIAGPKNGFTGAAAALPMRYALHNEAMLDKMARLSSSFGWKPEHFKESFEELKRTGKFLVEGEHTWKDDIADPPMAVNSMGQSVLNGGLVFFREGERVTRITSWNAAYLEWRKLNPTALVDDTVRRELMVRSDLMAANMTRASNASWQQGIMSLPAQFLSYHTRLAEQMLGKRLTGAEKARLIAMNSLMYGIPIGALGSSGLGALTGGQYPLHEEVRKEFLKRNIAMDGPMMVAFHGGLVNLLAHVVTGSDTDLASKLGPSGGQLFKNLLFDDKSLVESFFGASGSKAASIWSSLDPGMKAVMSPFRADEKDFPLKPEDAVGLLRNVKSVDHVVNVYYALNAGKIFAKNGQLQTEVSPMEAVFTALTGGQPRRVSDANMMQAMNIDRAKVLKEVMKETQRDADAMYKAFANNDPETGKIYEKRIATRMQLADVPMKDRANILRQIVGMNRESVERIIIDFNTKSAPASRQQQGTEFLIERDKKKQN